MELEAPEGAFAIVTRLVLQEMFRRRDDSIVALDLRSGNHLLPLMKLAVLNPFGNDPEQSFASFAGAPDDALHPPVNFHGFAACTGGSFHRKESAVPADATCVLLLLRRDVGASRQALIDLRRAGKEVLVSLKEAGASQVADLLSAPANLKLFREICARAGGAIATTEDLVPLYREAGAREVECIPTPYPIEDERWNFARPLEDRRGIFIGTREFRVLSRNHLLALFTIRPVAETMGQPVTVVNSDGRRGRKLLAQLGYSDGMLRVIEGRRPYPAYLRLVAEHRLVFQLDRSAVPGQVAGDALLCGIPCVGGDGTVERLAFPEFCGHGRTPERLADIATRLLDHPHDCEQAVHRALDLGSGRLSFTAVAKRLEEFQARIFRR